MQSLSLDMKFTKRQTWMCCAFVKSPAGAPPPKGVWGEATNHSCPFPGGESRREKENQTKSRHTKKCVGHIFARKKCVAEIALVNLL